MEIARKLKSEKESGVWGAARWRRGRKQADFAKRYEGLGVYCSIFNWSFEAGGRRGGRGAGGQEELHFRVEAGEGHDRRLRWLALINQKHWQTQRNSVHA